MTRAQMTRPTISILLFTTLGLAAMGCGPEGRGASGSTSAAICTRYLDCVEAIASAGGAAAAGYQAALDQTRAQYGEGGACDSSPQAREQCDLGCQMGLQSARQAFSQVDACAAPAEQGEKSSSTGSAPDQACQAYLSCLLAARPTSYAAALVLYGEKAACWDSPAQAASCQQACVAELADQADVCWCTGSTCQAYHTVSNGTYATTLTSPTDPSCPRLDSLKTATVHGAYSGSFQLDMQGSYMNGVEYVQGRASYARDAGSIDWYLPYGQVEGSPLSLTADDRFSTVIDLFGDGDCVYALSFSKL